jgi:xylitol oxidase
MFASAYSVSLFTDWQGDDFNQLWLKQKITAAAAPDPKPDLYGATAAAVHRHPITAISPENCTDQLGIPGPWTRSASPQAS